MCAHTECGDPLRLLLQQTGRDSPHGSHVEVIIVIVGDDHGVQPREFAEWQGWRVKAFGADELRR